MVNFQICQCILRNSHRLWGFLVFLIAHTTTGCGKQGFPSEYLLREPSMPDISVSQTTNKQTNNKNRNKHIRRQGKEVKSSFSHYGNMGDSRQARRTISSLLSRSGLVTGQKKQLFPPRNASCKDQCLLRHFRSAWTACFHVDAPHL